MLPLLYVLETSVQMYLDIVYKMVRIAFHRWVYTLFFS